MNDHDRKIVENCINKRADKHAELLKKLDETCEKIAKNEPKEVYEKQIKQATLNDLAVSVIKFGETMERVSRAVKAMNNKQPKIWLSLDEASEVWDSLVNLVSYVESIDGGMSVLVRDGQRNINLIRNRIKKVEDEE